MNVDSLKISYCTVLTFPVMIGEDKTHQEEVKRGEGGRHCDAGIVTQGKATYVRYVDLRYVSGIFPIAVDCG